MWPMSKSQSNTRTALAVLAVLTLVGAHAPALAAHVQSDGQAEVGFAPPLENEIVISDRDFNQFIFSAPIANGPIFPAGAPIVGKPTYLSNNTQLLLQVAQGASKPFNMFIELEDGTVHKLWLRPRPIPGVTRKIGAVSAARVKPIAATDAPESTSPRGADMDLLKKVVAGQIPDGFEPIDLPAPTRFDKFTVVPLAGWGDGSGKQILTFSLVATHGQTAVVAAPQFYRQGVTAVMIDGDTVDAGHSPVLYITEEAPSDE